MPNPFDKPGPGPGFLAQQPAKHEARPLHQPQLAAFKSDILDLDEPFHVGSLILQPAKSEHAVAFVASVTDPQLYCLHSFEQYSCVRKEGYKQKRLPIEKTSRECCNMECLD